jgi:DNA repair photolyase
VKEKHRIRVSLMPQVFSTVLEPNTDLIADRIKTISYLQQYMEVHINFSPIIYHDNWLEEYEKLFQQLEGIEFKSECILLTYNETQFKNNSVEINEICWKPLIQEKKNSEYADNNIRYKQYVKSDMVKKFKEVYSKYFDLNTIRYIF